MEFYEKKTNNEKIDWNFFAHFQKSRCAIAYFADDAYAIQWDAILCMQFQTIAEKRNN